MNDNVKARYMATDYPESLKGHFLMAMPGLMDPNFHQTVICLSEHTRDGAVGIVINRAHPSLKAAAIFSELQIVHHDEVGQVPVYLGGPVHASEVFILHGLPFDADVSLEITPHLAMSTTRDVLEQIALGKGPKQYVISLGCAGWGPGQLEAEIRQNAWLTCQIDTGIMFDTAVDKRWERAMRELGIDPALLIDAVGHA
jgi:putative transcriptional regulator